jgi:hypothetical protein
MTGFLSCAGMLIGSILSVLAFGLFGIALMSGAATLSLFMGEHAFSTQGVDLAASRTNGLLDSFVCVRSVYRDCQQLGILSPSCSVALAPRLDTDSNKQAEGPASC